MISTVFVLDANVFITAHRRYYGFDLCLGFWNCLSHYSNQKRILSIDRIREELLKGDDRLKEWVISEAPKTLFEPSNDEVVRDLFSKMMMRVDSQHQFKDEAKDEFARSNDGWLAAYAKVHGAVLIPMKNITQTLRKKCHWGTYVKISTCRYKTHLKCCVS